MALVGTAIAGTIFNQFTARNFTGKNISDVSSAIGTSVATYLTIPNQVTCYCSGTAGPIGQITGLAVTGIVPTEMSSLMLTKARSKSFKGKDLKKFFDAISFGLFPNLQSMVLSGQVAGCALGYGTGRFQAINEQAFSALLYTNMLKKQLKGKNSKDIADCVSFGLISHLLSSATFKISVAGAIAPVPPVGPVASAMILSLTTKLS